MIRSLALFLALATLTAACGSAGQDPPTGEAATPQSSAPIPSSSATPPAPTTVPQPTGLDAPSEPASTLPISRTFTFDHRVWGLAGFGRDVFTTGEGRLVRIRPYADQVDATVLLGASVPDAPKVDPFFLTTSGRHVVVSAVSRGEGRLTLSIPVDPVTLDVVGAIDVPFGQTQFPVPGTTGPGSEMLAFVDGGRTLERFDTEAVTVEGSVPAALMPNSLIERIGDEYWVWRPDGTGSVVDAESGEVVAQLDVGRPLPSFGAAVVAVDADSLWFHDGVSPVLERIDRASRDVTTTIDLAARWPDAAVVVRGGDRDGPDILVQVETPEEGWHLLLVIDPSTGAIVAEHVIATTDDSHGWTAFDVPHSVWVSNRLYVLDHPQRIVEVDMSALGTDVGPWTGAGVPDGWTFSDSERDVVDLMRAFVDPEQSVALTRDDLGITEELVADTAVVAYETTPADWRPVTAVVSGDRAHGRVAPQGGVGYPLVFVRVDGEWRVDAQDLCFVAFDFGNPCGV